MKQVGNNNKVNIVNNKRKESDHSEYELKKENNNVKNDNVGFDFEKDSKQLMNMLNASGNKKETQAKDDGQLKKEVTNMVDQLMYDMQNMNMNVPIGNQQFKQVNN